MENNIFIKKKEKYNPDIINNLSSTVNQRKQTTFKNSNEIYNPITNIVPNNINKSQDLKLQSDKPYSLFETRNLLKMKESERMKQNNELIPQKMKNFQSVVQQSNDFEGLKKLSEESNKKMSLEQSQLKNNYNNSFIQLKKMGLI